MSADVKYPEVEVRLTDRNGNAFVIVGAVQQALRKAKVPAEEVDAFAKEAMSGDFDHLLQTVLRTVTVA